ncbi:tryptophanyl-tRNAsynthetase,related [Neospora caninum Liverpool]|nr:tryptophanyl-tRNAsynthetase,related [Neospora caninum Liverpool]CBZ50370.1 tryptophanyl-tRNAsynthetase,related [Neospora caninum Liverpool]|eukprot:XP_003880404.1 tryptophanyl-tRNAsynthetase,related [Neospora caninum Liverpool]
MHTPHAAGGSAPDDASRSTCRSRLFLHASPAPPPGSPSSAHLNREAGADQAAHAAPLAFHLSRQAAPANEEAEKPLNDGGREHLRGIAAREAEHQDGRPLWMEDHAGHLDQLFRGSRVMTGLQPSGHLHLGNYFSVVRPLPTLESSGASITCLIGDLHASFGGLDRTGVSLLSPETIRFRSGRVNAADGDRLRGAVSRHGTSTPACGGRTADSNEGGSVEDTKGISEKTLDAVAMLLAAGIHPVLDAKVDGIDGSETRGNTAVVVQSLVPEHTMLATLLMGTTPLAWLERCTGASANIRRLDGEARGSADSGKHSALQGDEGRRADVGMRFYPLLMAADILSHDSDFVLVGGDQRQHVEFTRQVARRWNRSFLPCSSEGAGGDQPAGRRRADPLASSATGRLTSARPATRQGLCVPKMISYRRVSSRIGDLQSPGNKMSKSGSHASGSAPLNSKGCVFLLDPPDVIALKIAKAKTDTLRGLSYNRAGPPNPQREGVGDQDGAEGRAACHNLLHLWSAVTGEGPQEAASRFNDASWECFKKELAERLVDMLSPVQRRYREIRSDTPYLRRVIAAGARVARQRAAATLQHVRQAMTILDTTWEAT